MPMSVIIFFQIAKMSFCVDFFLNVDDKNEVTALIILIYGTKK